MFQFSLHFTVVKADGRTIQIFIKRQDTERETSSWVKLARERRKKTTTKIMGWFGSSEENIEAKTIDTSGNVNNNIIIQEARDTHSQMLIDEKILFATHILVAIKILQLIIYAFHALRKTFKRKYGNNNNG